MEEQFLDEGLEVVCVDIVITGAPENVVHLQVRDSFRLMKVDASDFISIPGPFDYILYVASPASPIDYAELRVQTMTAGSFGTLPTPGLGREEGAPYLLASTSETYGDPRVHPQLESCWGNVNPVRPRTELNWEPRVDVRDGLKDTIDWFRERRDPEAVATSSVSRRAVVHDNAERRCRVAVVGTGHGGALTATFMAFLGNEVFGFDRYSSRSCPLNNGQVPFIEPGLPEMLKAVLSSGRLRFTDRPNEVLTGADFVILCVGTPPAPNGSPDLKQLAGPVQSMVWFPRSDVVVVNMSNIPVGSGNFTRTILEDAALGCGHQSLRVVSNPELLREGSATTIPSFLNESFSVAS